MRAIVRAVALTVAMALAIPSVALAAHGQVAILQDDTNLFQNPALTLREMRHLGVEMVRATVRWSSIAPAGNSRHRPSFNATDPNAYPARGWAPYDAVVRNASADGIRVLFTLSGFAPLWAQGPNPGRFAAHYSPDFAFEPSAAQFGKFVRAIGRRYSGTFTPRGESSPLPRVSAWELWNEPNFGEDLAPQAIDGSRILYAPRMYRGLAGAAWGALAGTGHGGDTIIIGAFAAKGAQVGPHPGAPQGLPGTYGETKPLVFVRELYCLDPRLRPYRGAAARARGCPTNAAGSRRFRARNPVLFKSSGFSDHPYMLSSGRPPTRADSADPSYAEFPELPRFGRFLDRIQRVYRSGKHLPIWNTEYGYLTNPPNRSHGYVSPATAGYFINWAEYLSWRNPRIASTMQYLLYDPNPTVGTPEYGGFASGLVFYPTVMGGGPKASYYAYRLPIYLPRTTTRHGRKLEVWGGVRPAPYALLDTGQPQYVQIQFNPASGGSWQTIQTLRITDPHGYFDSRVAFPSSGQVRISWTYPPTDGALSSSLVTGYTEPLGATSSRTVQISIK